MLYCQLRLKVSIKQIETLVRYAPTVSLAPFPIVIYIRTNHYLTTRYSYQTLYMTKYIIFFVS